LELDLNETRDRAPTAFAMPLTTRRFLPAPTASPTASYEFGLNAMRAHWQSGLDDIRRYLADPRRLDPPAPELGIVTHHAVIEF
jgi:hypothetical protein